MNGTCRADICAQILKNQSHFRQFVLGFRRENETERFDWNEEKIRQFHIRFGLNYADLFIHPA